MDEAATEAYIRELYAYVLDRQSVSDREVADWMGAARNGMSPVEMFRTFATSKENTKRRADLSGSRTKFRDGHFYSPVVNVVDLASRRQQIAQRGSPAGVKIDAEQQLAELARLTMHADAMPFTDEKTAENRYYYRNPSYGFGDACIYWGMLANLRPRRIIEIGSGFSSALALDSIDRLGLATTCTFIDPYPQVLQQLAAPIDPRHRVIEDLVQNVDPSIVTELGRNDILFIDSSHVVKSGSDVLFELTELLPRLPPGAVVHFHDAFYPFEYPLKWVLDDNRSWNELYFLHAFLMYNHAFEIRFFNHFVATTQRDAVRRLIAEPLASRLLLNPGGGLWLTRSQPGFRDKSGGTSPGEADPAADGPCNGPPPSA